MIEKKIQSYFLYSSSMLNASYFVFYTHTRKYTSRFYTKVASGIIKASPNSVVKCK